MRGSSHRLKTRSRSFAACAWSVAVLVSVSGLAVAADEFKEARKRYKAYLKRPSLYMRHRGRERLAETGDARALDLLSKSYAKPEKPKDQVRYLLVSMCARHFDDATHLGAFAAWRRKHTQERDAWLWFRALGVEVKQGGPGDAGAIVTSTRPGVLRAAALEALAERDDLSALAPLAEALADLPTKPFDRALLLQAAAHVLFVKRSARQTPEYRSALAALIAEFDAKSTPARSRLVIARRLANIFGARTIHLEGAAWHALMEGKRPPRKPHAGQPGASTRPPYFLGIKGSGMRVAYVIDLSDSMLTPLTGSEVEDLKDAIAPKRRRPIPRVTGDPPEPPKSKPDAASDAARLDLPWESIHTRFDAAREFLQLSLLGLQPHQSYCVIYFGTEAGTLESTPGLRRATPENVGKTIRELDAIETGPPKSGRPHGTLRGFTNMHGGLHRAFKLAGRGLVRRYEYVDRATFEKGCETIYLLSDGRPTWDDWPEWDDIEREDDPGDPESGAKRDREERGHFYGPHVRPSVISDEIRRLNLFRKVEIHCIGLGEYDPTLLAYIAHLGMGQFRRIGGEGGRK